MAGVVAALPRPTRMQVVGVATLAAAGGISVWETFSKRQSNKILKRAGTQYNENDTGLRHRSNLPTSSIDVVRSMLYSLRSPHLIRMVIASLVLSMLTRIVMPTRRKRRTVPTFFLIMWALYYQFRVRERPQVQYVRTPYNVQLVERSRIMRRFFSPVFWAFNSHVQTALCTVLNDWALLLQPIPTMYEERIPAFDGNSVILYWAHTREEQAPDVPVVLLSHGIIGGPEENYVKNMFSIAVANGWRPVLLYRWRLDFHDTRDMATALNTIKARYPRAPIFAIGYSAGAHVLLTYLNQYGRDTPLVAAALVGGAYNMLETMYHTMQSSNRTYVLALTYAVKQCVLRHVRHVRESERAVFAPLLARLSDLDDPIVIYDEFAALCGNTLSGMGAPYTPGTVNLRLPSMKPREAHYSLVPGEHLSKVAVTTLVVHAEDDPITPLGAPYFRRVFQNIRKNPHFVQCTTRRGGHVGWHQGAFPAGHSWADVVVTDFIGAVLGNLSDVTFMLHLLRNVLSSDTAAGLRVDLSRGKQPADKPSVAEAALQSLLKPTTIAAGHDSGAVPGSRGEGLAILTDDSDDSDDDVHVSPRQQRGRVAGMERRHSQPAQANVDEGLDSARASKEGSRTMSPDRMAHLIAEAAQLAPTSSLVRVQSMPQLLRSIGRRDKRFLLG